MEIGETLPETVLKIDIPELEDEPDIEGFEFMIKFSFLDDHKVDPRGTTEKV